MVDRGVKTVTYMKESAQPLRHRARITGIESKYLMLGASGGFSSKTWEGDSP